MEKSELYKGETGWNRYFWGLTWVSIHPAQELYRVDSRSSFGKGGTVILFRGYTFGGKAG
jgi:hypothetical protein